MKVVHSKYVVTNKCLASQVQGKKRTADIQIRKEDVDDSDEEQPTAQVANTYLLF
jgi:hypothetical protein